MPDSLKPCPFCGAGAHFESDADGRVWVECESCGMASNRSASLMDDFIPPLAETWNRRALPAPAAGEPELPDVDDLAQEIRRVDGDHSLGAGALAEALMPFLEAHRALPAPAGEPEMPANAAYWWSPKDGAMAGTWSSNTGPHPDWDVTHYFTTDQLRAYGDARAEHARRVAMEEAALTCEGEAVESTEHESDKGYNMAIRHCADAIRAAAPPQGEQT